MKRLVGISMISILLSVLSTHAYCQQVTLKKLTNMSSDVVRVDVLSVKSFCHEESKNEIYTSVIVSITDNIKGSLKTGSTIELIRHGGVVGDRFVRLSEYASFEAGQSSILFLKEYTHDYFGLNYSIIGSNQGKFNIDQKGKVTRKTTEALRITENNSVQYFGNESDMSSTDFISIIKQTVNDQ